MSLLYVIEKTNKHNNLKTLFASYDKEEVENMFNYLKEEEYNVTLKKFKKVE